MRHEGRVVLVTGAGAGIGKSTARLFAEEGARLIVADTNRSAGEETASQIEGAGGQALYVEMDVSVSEQVRKGITAGVRKFGGLDILVNNAGISVPHGPISEVSEETWDLILGVNLKGAFLCSKYAIPYLKEGREGGRAIVNIASVAGLFGEPNAAPYCASKGGMIALTRAVAMDYAPFGIRVNCICPGAVMTPLQERWYARHEDPNHVKEMYDAAYPLRRIAKPEEIGRLVSFLASEEASFITGAYYLIDGGMYSQNPEVLIEGAEGSSGRGRRPPNWQSPSKDERK